jgi:hypothetical protein
MQYLAAAGNTIGSVTELGSDEDTRSFSITFGYAILTLIGDFSGETVTVEMSPTGPTGTFASYIVKDVTGTAAALAFTDDESVLIVGPGQTFRCSCSSGGTPDIDILVSGAGVILH